MAIEYQQATDIEIRERVRQKYKATIHKLKFLNFEELCFFSETIPAFGLTTGPLGVLGVLAALPNEVSKVERNLSASLFFILMVSREFDTYVAPFGLGVKFYTSFTDGTFVITANFDSPPINDDREKLYKFAQASPIEAAWKYHQARVEQLIAAGKQRRYLLSFHDFVRLTKQEDNYMLKPKFAAHAITHDLLSTILSGIVSVSLFAGVALMFWSLPRIVHELYPDCWFVRNVDNPPLLINFLLIPACIALSWLLARIQKTPLTVDGVGTRFFGRSPSTDSHGYISTKWLAVVFVPVLPVRAYQVIEEDLGGEQKTKYSIHPLEKLDWAQIRETIGKSIIGYMIFAILLFGFGAWALRECL